MGRQSSLIGKTVRCFTVLECIHEPGKKERFILKCNFCGAIVSRGATSVRGSRVLCDCQKDHIPEYRGTNRKSPLYNSYRAMLARCYDPKSVKFPDYGGRGIVVCEEWQTFPPFEAWAMSNGWAPGLSIDRIDVNGNYEPSNCRWADATTQSNNRRGNRYLTYEGKTKTLKQWADSIGISYSTLIHRVDSGWPIEMALETAVRPTARVSAQDRLYTYMGESKLLTQWAKEYGIRFSTLRQRIERQGWSIERALTTPIQKPNDKREG